MRFSRVLGTGLRIFGIIRKLSVFALEGREFSASEQEVTMRRVHTRHGTRVVWAALGVVLGFVGRIESAHGQAVAPPGAILGVPEPTIPNIEERSGLLTRFQPRMPNLPPDPDRDEFFDSRYGDPPNVRLIPNAIKNGGLYGMRWRGNCTAAYYPFFFGSPGGNTITPDCKPAPRTLRYLHGFLHPFKPVGFYYDQGVHVPLYDLDPVVPGPGPFPFPWYWRGPKGG